MLYLVGASSENDLSILLREHGINYTPADTLSMLLDTLTAGDAVICPADNYPSGNATIITQSELDFLMAKGVRLFWEFPVSVPGLEWSAELYETQYERSVVAKDIILPDGAMLNSLTILCHNGCFFHKLKYQQEAILTAARVAGYRKAIYGLPEHHHPLLFVHPLYKNVLIGNANFSSFRKARFAPMEDWATLLRWILHFLMPDAAIPELRWEMTVHPSYSETAELPSGIEMQAFNRNCAFISHNLLSWYQNEGMMLVAEGYSSGICYDGTQYRRQNTRGDVAGEVPMVFALDYALNGNFFSKITAERILNYLFTSPSMCCLEDGSPVFGQLKFFENIPAYYGDDNFRAAMGAVFTSSLLNTDCWDKSILRTMLSVLNTTGKLGFRRDRLDYPLSFTGKDGHPLEFYQNEELENLDPHQQAYVTAGFIMAYKLTGLRRFLDYAKKGIYRLMEAYPDVNWMNGWSQEMARMLLPLAWLIREEDTPFHRQLLERVMADLKRLTEPCGAIREIMGNLKFGKFPSPQSNDAYGTTEASLIQQNGDPACDLLYTTNYAFIGLHEAVAATGNPEYLAMEDKLADFLCRIQVSSKSHSYLDGAWMRGFDWTLWDYYASSADSGWGAWSIESGWTNNWISSVLAMRHAKLNFWDMIERGRMSGILEAGMKEFGMTE